MNDSVTAMIHSWPVSVNAVRFSRISVVVPDSDMPSAARLPTMRPRSRSEGDHLPGESFTLDASLGGSVSIKQSGEEGQESSRTGSGADRRNSSIAKASSTLLMYAMQVECLSDSSSKSVDVVSCGKNSNSNA